MTTANTDTPRTEAALMPIYARHNVNNYPEMVVAKFARELERESARYKALAQKLAKVIDECDCDAAMLEHSDSLSEYIRDNCKAVLTEARAAGLLKETTP